MKLIIVMAISNGDKNSSNSNATEREIISIVIK